MIVATPDTTDLAFAKAIFAGQVKVLDMTKVVMTNATVGAKIDNDQKTNPEDTELTNPITESDLEYVVSTENKFNALAEAYLTTVLKVATFVAKKYSRGGWQHVENGVERYTDAMFRLVPAGDAIAQ